MKIKTINKKGILVSETVRIILGVIALLLLVYLAFQLTGLFIKKSAQEQAKESMKVLIDGIKSVENGEKEQVQLFIESPNNWWITAWPFREDARKPKQCKDYCICFCPVPGKVDKGVFSNFENSLEYCNNLGVCENLDKPIKTIYESQTGSGVGETIKSIVSFFGGDTKNAPIDINQPLPIKIKLNEGVVNIIK